MALASFVVQRLGASGFSAFVLGRFPDQIIFTFGADNTAAKIVAMLNGLSVEPPVGSLHFATDGTIWRHTAAGTTADKWSAVLGTTLAGLTASVAELNILDGCTATAAQINAVKGMSVMAHQAHSEAADIAGLVSDFNAFLDKAVAAGDMAAV